MNHLQGRVARLEAVHRFRDGGPYSRERAALAAEVAHALRARPPGAEIDEFLCELLHRVETDAATAADTLVLSGCSLGTLRTMQSLAAGV